MLLHNWALVAILSALSWPTTAFAQAGATTSDPVGVGSPTTATPSTRQTAQIDDSDVGVQSAWIASGFVGSNFGASADGNAVDFGGSLGYLWRSAVGAEFLAGFTPDFELQPNAILNDTPQVNSYMVNAIGAIPIGADAQWQPFISGGLGAISLGSSLVNVGNNGSGTGANTFEPDDTRFGGNIGGGLMGYVGNWGVRGDVRYFRAFETDSAASNPVQNILPGLDFWRANIGVALRW